MVSRRALRCNVEVVVSETWRKGTFLFISALIWNCDYRRSTIIKLWVRRSRCFRQEKCGSSVFVCPRSKRTCLPLSRHRVISYNLRRPRTGRVTCRDRVEFRAWWSETCPLRSWRWAYVDCDGARGSPLNIQILSDEYYTEASVMTQLT